MLQVMKPVWRRLQRIELGLELALMGAILELFHRGIRPGLDVGCGSAMNQFSDDALSFFSDYRMTLIVPAAVALVELQVAFRPWVKRTIRLGGGAALAAMLLSYATSVWSFIR